MDPRRPQDPNERPSIFSRSDDEDDHGAAEPPRRPESPGWHDTETRAHAVGSTGAAHRPAPTDSEPLVARTRDLQSHRASPSDLRRRRKLAIAGTALAGLVAVGFVVALLGRSAAADAAVAGGSASPVSSPSMTVEPTASSAPSATEEPSSTPSPSSSSSPPTPAPTLAGPPQELALGGWATVSVGELNVRSDPGLNAGSDYRLVEGAVVHLREEPAVSRDGLLWYRVRSLGGADGWAASGPASTPFLTMLVSDAYLLHCGIVDAAVFDADGSRLVARDPLRVAGLALPTAAFTEAELAVLELFRGIKFEFCLGIEAAPDGSTSIVIDNGAWACGRPEIRDGISRLVPHRNTDAAPEIQVKQAAFVHPAALTSQLGDVTSSRNLRTVFELTAANPDATTCIELRVDRVTGDAEHYQGISAGQCLVIEEWDGVDALVRPASGGTAMTFRASYLDESLPIGVPVPVSLSAYEDSRTMEADSPSSWGSISGWMPIAGCG